MSLVNHIAVEQLAPTALKPYARNARTHSKRQISQIVKSIEKFGFTNPILIDDDNQILAGHGRHAAAKAMGLDAVPCLRFGHMSEDDKRAYILADNKIAANAGWDSELLAIEFESLTETNYELDFTGFSIGEIDTVLETAREAKPGRRDVADNASPDPGPTSCLIGDVWLLGRHRLVCGDATDPSTYRKLMWSEAADMVFTDPPYNVPIDGHVSGKGEVVHREFTMGSGEMTPEAFTAFLTTSLGHAAAACKDGSIAYVCMDWRHLGELTQAGNKVFSELKNMCVWNKTNAGMGTFYRSKHELVLVYKVGTAPHLNTFGLGEGGRHRTNVWDYPGVTSMSKERSEQLAMHPTVKPVRMIADAILDVTKRGGVVLDPFGGSGSTLIAAEKVGRSARLIELDPIYCDVIIRRWQTYTGKNATLDGTGRTYEDIMSDRAPRLNG